MPQQKNKWIEDRPEHRDGTQLISCREEKVRRCALEVGSIDVFGPAGGGVRSKNQGDQPQKKFAKMHKNVHASAKKMCTKSERKSDNQNQENANIASKKKNTKMAANPKKNCTELGKTAVKKIQCNKLQK